jgi:hypothetical protein
MIASGALALPELSFATLSGTQYFDLSSGSTRFVYSAALRNPTTKLQSFGFDHINQRIYVVQCTGAEYDGVSATQHGYQGDLTVSQLDYSGNLLGYMYLQRCGHGVQIGVQPTGSGSAPWIWVEYDCPIITSGDTWGTRLMRFQWANTEVIHYGDSTVHQHTPVANSTNNTCNIDPVYNRLILRFITNGVMQYAIYNLQDVINDVYTPILGPFAQPALVDNSGNALPAFQGYCLLGEYLYMLSGDAASQTVCPGAQGATPVWVTCFNVNTQQVTQRVSCDPGYSIGFREPEGMAIYLDSSGSASSARMMMGLGGYPSTGTYACNTGRRAASFYYKGTLTS